MKAQLELRNIGGFRGIKRFDFEKGAVNEVEAANAIGKTSLIRGLACVLAYPLSHDEAIKEAKNQGLRESLKNIYESDAMVHLKYDGNDEQWQMQSDGTFAQLPKNGNEGFLYAGMLTQEAQTIRQLVGGNSDFSWVARRLSYAQRYATAKAFIDSQITDAELNTGIIDKKRETLIEEDKALTQKRNERAKLAQTIDELAQKLDERKRQHLEQMKGLDTEIHHRADEISKHKARTNVLEQELERLEAKLESNAKNMQQLEEQLQSINMEAIRQEVIQNVSQVDEQIGKLRAEVVDLEGRKSTFTDAKSVLVQRGEKEGLCPVCERSTVRVAVLEGKISEINSEVQAKQKEIQALASDRTRWLQKEATVRQEIDQLNRMVKGLNDEKRELNSTKSRSIKELETLRKSLAKLEDEQTTVTEQRMSLERETEKWEAETHEALSSIETRAKVLNSEIAEHTRKIEEGSLTSLYGRERSSFQEWQNRLQRYRNKLGEMAEFFERRRHQHEVQAIADFNNNVRRVMDDLGFTEFDQIAIDKDDMRLKVLRSGFIRQPVESLSTTEKYSIAIVLQIALKETYLPDIPFFIVDEVVVSYDEEKKQRILDYLGQMAKEKEVYVIVTKLSEKAGEQILVKVR